MDYILFVLSAPHVSEYTVNHSVADLQVLHSAVLSYSRRALMLRLTDGQAPTDLQTAFHSR